MKTAILYTFTLLLISCGSKDGEPTQLNFQKVEQANFENYINNKTTPVDPNIYQDKTLFNNDYPIEITLYKDGRWFYHLANLDDGFGTWKYEDGLIKLHASRSLFDMHINIESLNSDASEIAIRFSDRFGEKVLKMQKRNIENN